MPFTVQHLLRDQQKLVTVFPNEPLQRAVDLMIEHGFSQLPVIDDEKRSAGLVTNIEIAPREEALESGDSKYAPLALWLQQRPAPIRRASLTFDEIENIIGDKLPTQISTGNA